MPIPPQDHRNNGTGDARYRRAICGLPLPSPAQIDDFARHVAQDHSWYKWLPLSPPGIRFHFFVTPLAGWSIHRDCVKGACYARSCDPSDRLGRELTTDEYRERFGYLDYGTASSDDPFLPSGNVLRRWFSRLRGEPLLVSPVQLPESLTRTGSAWLSAFIDTRVVREDGLFTLVDKDLGELLPHWPEASGGEETRQKILARARAASDSWISRRSASPCAPTDADEDAAHAVRAARAAIERRHPLAGSGRFDRALYELVAPEQDRQFAEMKAAISRACQWARDNGAG